MLSSFEGEAIEWREETCGGILSVEQGQVVSITDTEVMLQIQSATFTYETFLNGMSKTSWLS